MINLSVSQTQVKWYDGQQIDQDDMTTESDRNVKIDASIVQNHFGSGVLPSSSSQIVIFDTDYLFSDQAALIASNDFDGTGLRPLVQPSDAILGNQLEVELLDSETQEIHKRITKVGGRLSIKVLIIGLDFQGNLQYDRFYFYKKEKQATKKHYAKILAIFTNDFLGNDNCSRLLGGRVVIRETSAFQLSRDGIMIAQDVQPNLFFRDFKTPNPAATLYQTIQAGIGLQYNVDALHINTTVKSDFEFVPGDVTTRISEKFLAKNNNIQKITVLLGVRKNNTDIEHYYDWSGELVVSVFELQSTVTSPTELVPGLAIEFDPNPIPLTQFSIDKVSLENRGYVLTDVLQPIDLIYNNSILGNSANPVIVPGKYYAISIGRAGDSSTGTIFTGIGNSQVTDDRLSIFTTEWTDIPEADLWYQVWSDTAKVADGMAYDAGNGIQIPKTTINDFGAVVDYAFDQNSFADTGQNTLNTGVVEAVERQFQQAQDERTGNPVFSRQQFEPSFSFATSATLSIIRENTDPVIIGCSRDVNAKVNNVISGTQIFPGLAKGNTFIIINPNADLISQQLVGSKLIPNNNCAGIGYSISAVRLCTDGYGDVNGDGIIDHFDYDRVTQLLGQSLSLESTQALINAGVYDTLEIIRADVDGDGYVSHNDIDLISAYISKDGYHSFPVGSSFTHIEIEVQNSTGRYDGYYDCDGYIRVHGDSTNKVNPADLSAIDLKYYGFNSVPNITAEDPAFILVPFVPVPFVVAPIPFWKDYMLQVSSEARLVPATFTFANDTRTLIDQNTGVCIADEAIVCIDPFEFGGACNPGRNDFFVPDNLIIGKGQILDRSGNYFKQDFEVHTIVLELPQGIKFNQAVIDVYQKLVLDSGDGFTSTGYPAAKFADCTTVKSGALESNQLRFGVSIQSIFPNQDGTDIDGYGIIIDNVFGVHMDQSTGLMTLTINDISSSAQYPDLRTKVLITVYLKKAGWSNVPLVIPYNQIAGLFMSGVA
ncbi:dockerin type I repeat-containing protein [Candidatus Pacearchaeota archaeon]|jgi:hypothetical protein|nr:dockerin type I repeat-containing protein [Candidatus Pacearchaeota archaeon]